MTIALDYTSLPPSIVRRRIGAAAVVVATTAAVGINVYSVIVSRSLMSLMFWPCGTPLAMERHRIYEIGAGLAIPAAAWFVSRYARYGQFLCRCSLWGHKGVTSHFDT